MCAYYYRRGYRRDWQAYHATNRSRLASVLGGIEDDVWKIFLALPSYAREGFFRRFEKVHGKAKTTYARGAYREWQDGVKAPSAETLSRIVELLPPSLSDDQRFKLIKKLRNYHYGREKETLKLLTTPEQWREELLPLIKKQLDAGAEFELPAEVMAKASWLSQGGSQSVIAILKAIDAEEAKLRLGFIEDEFHRIAMLLEHVKNLEPVEHKIILPQGDIQVTIRPRSKSVFEHIGALFQSTPTMSENNLVPKQDNQLARKENPGSLLNVELQNLTAEQRARLTERVVDEKLTLDVNHEKAEQRFHNSTRDMANTVRAADAIASTTKADFEVHSTHDTASGRTDIRIKKNGGTVIIVVAVVVGIIIFTLLRK